MLLSVGLFRRVPYAHMHDCVQGAYSSGGDAMFTECLWKARAYTGSHQCPCASVLCMVLQCLEVMEGSCAELWLLQPTHMQLLSAQLHGMACRNTGLQCCREAWA